MIDYTRETATPPYVDTDAEVSYGALLAQTMMLVAVAIGLLTLGSFIGSDYSRGTALVFSLTGFGMLMAQSFITPLRSGLIGTTWLFALSLAIGLGLGPVLASYLSFNPDVVAEAAGMTGVTVLGAATIGTFTGKDLAKWMRPISLIVFVAALASWVMFAAGAGGSPIISVVIGLFSAVLIVVYFNYLRRHATGQDVVWIATGIFVAIINIFLSFLNLGD